MEEFLVSLYCFLMSSFLLISLIPTKWYLRVFDFASFVTIDFNRVHIIALSFVILNIQT